MLAELIELNQIRLDEDKSYAELASEIGLGNPSTLNRLLRGERGPMDRTLHKIRRFLDGRRTLTAKARKKTS